MNPAFTELFTAWEKSMSSLADNASRQPQLLELGAGLMKAHVAWVHAVQATVEAWAPLVRATRGE